MSLHRRQVGFTLIELMLALTMSAVLVTALMATASSALHGYDAARERQERLDAARFAMDRLTRAVGRSAALILPRPNDPGSLRDESALDVLALRADPALDLDFDGVPDADNDADGRIDEDPGADMNGDGEPGIACVDDDNDGSVDEGSTQDDDEDAGLLGILLGGLNEDPVDGVDGVDDDGDRGFDEDAGADLNGDGAPGIAGFDDDGDGAVDEGAKADDDEDGRIDEDWIDTVVFRRDGDRLLERVPVPWDVDGDGTVTGADFVETVIAERVAAFEVERLPRATGAVQRVRIRLALTVRADEPVVLATELRLGARL